MFLEAIQSEIINLAIVVITTCIGLGTTYVVNFLKEKGIVTKLEKNRKSVEIIVNAVEQLYKEYDGKHKFTIAKKKVIESLNKKKIDIDEDDIDTLIESVVNDMNKTIKKELNK